MKKLLLLISPILLLSACGPNADDMKRMKQEAQATFDSLDAIANKKIKDDLRKNDSINQLFNGSDTVEVGK